MRDVMRFLGVAGLVLVLFGLLPFSISGEFDLWTAVHLVGGGILLAAGVLLNLTGFRRTLTSRSVREIARTAFGTALFLGILVAVNVLALRHPIQYDATENRVHTLSDRTRAVAAGIVDPVELIAFWPAGEPGREAAQALLERYGRLSGTLSWRLTDAVGEPRLAENLGVDRQPVLIGRRGAESGREFPDPAMGLSEGAVTNLLLKLTRPGSKRIYALDGHGEPRVQDLETGEGLGAATRLLADDAFEVRPLLLATESGVPDDAALVLVVGPQKPLSEHELEQLAAYLDRGGRVMLLLDPRLDVGLNDLVARWGVELGDDMIVDQEQVPFLGPRLGLAPIVEDFPPHPITRNFEERVLLYQARSVRPASPTPQGLDVTVVARTSTDSWAETDVDTMFSTGQVAQDGQDSPGPVPVAVAVEQRPAAPEDEPTRAARLLVVGDADWVRNATLNRFFNQEFLVAGVQWLVGNEELIAEGPRGFRPSRLEMTDADYRNVFRLTVLLFPEALLLFGLSLWWRRRTL